MNDVLQKYAKMLIYTPGHRDIHVCLYHNNKPLLRYLDFKKVREATDIIVQMLHNSQDWSILSHPETSRPVGFSFPPRLLGDLQSVLSPENNAEIDFSEVQLYGFFFPVFSSVFYKWMEQAKEASETTNSSEPKESPSLHLAMIATDQDNTYQNTDTLHLKKILEHFATLATKERPDIFSPIIIENFPPIKDKPQSFEGIVDYVHERLQPSLDDFLSRYVGKEWRKRFTLDTSMNLGTSAMAYGLYAALRYYRPNVLHTPQAMSPLQEVRWLETERHATELVDQIRIVPRHALKTPLLQGLVDKMEEWKKDFPSLPPLKDKDDEKKGYVDIPKGSKTLEPFWYRQSKRQVLAVLALDRGDEGIDYIRACNLEVSLPTGTLCAERSAIAQALSKYPNLRREEIAAVAVFSKAGVHPLLPCGACKEWLEKISEVNPHFEVVTFGNEDLSRVHLQKL